MQVVNGIIVTAEKKGRKRGREEEGGEGEGPGEEEGRRGGRGPHLRVAGKLEAEGLHADCVVLMFLLMLVVANCH